MYVCIEGIDGSGKTCVSKSISEKIGYRYQTQKVLAEYLGMEEDDYLMACKSYREKVNFSSNELYWFYATNCLLNGRGTDNTICDRHLSTLYFWYGNEDNYCIPDSIYKICGKPVLTIILDVSKENAQKRVMSRYSIMDSKHDYDIDRELSKSGKADLFVKKVVDYCRHFSLNYKIIDTNNYSADEVAEIALEYIRGL